MLEAKIVYRKDLVDILTRLDNGISRELLNLVGKEVDTRNNYFDTVFTRNDKISYTSGDKKNDNVSYEIINPGQTYETYVYLFQIAGLTNNEYPPLPSGTIGKVKTLYTKANAPEIGDRNIAHFLTDDGESCFIGITGLREYYVNNTEARIGRVIRKLLNDAKIEFVDKDIEEFVNDYKTRVDIINDKFRFISIVSGEDIRKSYLYSNTYQIGQLGNSCMRHEECQKYLDIYVDNCKLMILKDEDSDKIRGRALLWELTNGEMYLDRQYSTSDTEMLLMESYAKEQGWAYLKNNDLVIHPSGEEERKHKDTELIVKLDNFKYDYYPYMDSVYNICKDTGYLGSKEALIANGIDYAYECQSESGGSDFFKL